MRIKNTLLISMIILLFVGNSASSQIEDIKKHSRDNQNNHASNSTSDDDDDDSGSCLDGCGVLAELFSLFGNNDSDNNNQTYSDFRVADENTLKFDTVNGNVTVTEEPVKNDINQESLFPISVELNMSAALGFEHSRDTNYTYLNYLPGLRFNLRIFALDFRYNILTEKSEKLPDAFKTWDLLFLLNLNLTPKFALIFGTGLHKEQYSSMLYNQHYLEIRTFLANNRDYLNINGRLTIDYQTKEFPFSEYGIHYNLRFINSNHFCGYLSMGGMYQNYYSSSDIWSLRGGILFTIH